YFDPNTTTGAWAYIYTPFDTSAGNSTGFYPVANARVKSYECPSDNPYNAGVGIIDAYWTQQGFIWIDFVPYGTGTLPNQNAHLLGASNYIANAGALGDDPQDPSGASFWLQFMGPFGPNPKTKITDCTDGSSNTIVFGEALPGSSGGGANDFVTNGRDVRLPWFGAA